MLGNRDTIMRLKGRPESLALRGLGRTVGMSCEGGVEDKITGGKEGKEVRDPRVLKKGSPVWTLNSPGLVLRIGLKDSECEPRTQHLSD